MRGRKNFLRFASEIRIPGAHVAENDFYLERLRLSKPLCFWARAGFAGSCPLFFLVGIWVRRMDFISAPLQGELSRRSCD